MSTGLFNQSQVSIRADLGGEGGVIYDSCVSLTQGLWPPTPNNSIALAIGSTITAPLNGYQSIPINPIDPNMDVSLEGFLDCKPFSAHTTAFYNSPQFAQMASQSASFLSLLKPYLNDRPATLQNMWNIYDFMNVNSIHNTTFAQSFPPTFLAQACALANWHEYNIFTDVDRDDIGNIAGQTMVPSLPEAFDAIVDPGNLTKLFVTAITYKPFLSLFNMTGVAAANPQLAGIMDYASAVTLEVRQSSGQPVVRFKFKNGSDPTFTQYSWMGTTGVVPLQTLVDTLQPSMVNGTAAWCGVCQNTQDRGCTVLSLTAANAPAAAFSLLSPTGAGILGALAFATLAVFGCLTCAPLLRGRRAKGLGGPWTRRTAAAAGEDGDDEVELNKTRTDSQSRVASTRPSTRGI